MRRKLSLLLAIIMMLSLVAACTTTTPPPATTAPPTTAPPPTDPPVAEKIAIYNIGVIDTALDPTDRHTTGTVNMFININGYLMRYNLHDDWEFELASGYTISDDQLVWTIKLKPDLKFSSGNPITADDVIFSWTRALDPEYAGEYAFILYYIKGGEAFNNSLNDDSPVSREEALAELGLKKIDNLTVEVTLEEPTPFFNQLLGYNTYCVLDKAFMEAMSPYPHKDYGTSPEKLSTSGPFMVVEYKQDEYVLTKKNPNYYDASKVKLDGVKFLFVQESSTELNMFEAGEIHLINLAISAADQNYYAAQNKLIMLPTLGAGWIGYNCVKAPYDDVRVRKALVLALDMELIVDTIIKGGTVAADGFVPHMPDPAGGKAFRDYSLINTTPKADEAKALLAEAGYPGGAGFPTDTTIIFTAPGDMNRAISEAMCAMWKETLGITVSPEAQEAGARLANRREGNFDLAFQGWGADYADPTTFLDCLLSDHFYNYGKYLNPDFDAAMKNAAANGRNLSVRSDYLREAEIILCEDMPMIMTTFSSKVYLQSPLLVDVVASPMAIFDLKWADLK